MFCSSFSLPYCKQISFHLLLQCSIVLERLEVCLLYALMKFSRKWRAFLNKVFIFISFYLIFFKNVKTLWYDLSSAYVTTVLYLPEKKILVQLQGHKILLGRLSAVHVCQKLNSCAESERCVVHKMWPLYPVVRKFSPFSRFAVSSCLSSLMLSSKLRTKISQAVASFKAPRTKLCTHWSFCKNAVCMLCVFCPCCPGLWNLLQRTSGCGFVLRHRARRNIPLASSVLSAHLHCFLEVNFVMFYFSVHLLWMSRSILYWFSPHTFWQGDVELTLS